MIDDYLYGISFRGLEDRINEARKRIELPPKDVMHFADEAAYTVQRAASERPANSAQSSQSSSSSIAAQLEKFVENGLSPGDLVRYGIKNAMSLTEATEMSEETKLELLQKAATSLLLQGAPDATTALKLLID